ncbi:MAG: hypothetical protein ACJ8G4_07350, partial [Burkholderiales bacterium]
PYIQNHTAPANQAAPARPTIDAAPARSQPWRQRVEQQREFRREPARAASQAPVAIPQQQAMRSIAATVRNQAQQPPHMRAQQTRAPQGGTRMQSSGGNHQRRG